jgi:tetratricopeptide (TPR) repeat protein
MNQQLIDLIEQGNQHRANHEPEQSLKCYAQVFVEDPDNAAAFCNYGNVMRELGYPQRAIPFLQHSILLDPSNTTTQFNLAVAYLLAGDYKHGWAQYETRWQFEHLNGAEPKFVQPRWRGEDIKGKTILVVGEQGHGDCIQFSRFIFNLHALGAQVKLQVTDGLIPLLNQSNIIERVGRYDEDMGEFDYWVPIMSIPGILGITLDNLARLQNYLTARSDLIKAWQDKLGPKTRMRVGFSWSGRKDSWIHQHKSVPFPVILDLIKSNPQYEWINLQIDASPEEEEQLSAVGVTRYPGSISSFADTAALIMHMDVVVSVDTAISHLAGSLGRPTWVMLNQYGQDWRWLLDRNNSPWYPTATLFRQPTRGDWTSVTKKIAQYLSWYKV